jgi:hypothetical protein
MLRPDPAQMPRPAEIVENLTARLDEARRQGWLGEVDGIRISLEGAKQKPEQTKTSPARIPRSVVALGMPGAATKTG